jgi:AcrR family transcriptional regulator
MARQADDTRERLMEAGRRLFAEGGFAGTSIRDLTREAGVNLGAVTYHFGSKEGLYTAVLEQCFAPVRERLAALGRLAAPAPERLELFVRGMFRHLAENPDLPRFMVQEVVLGEVPSPRILDAIKLVIGTLSGILRDGQKEGTVVPGDPVLLALSTLSQPIYLTIMPRVLKREMPRDRDLPVPRKSPENHAVAFLRRGFLLEEQRNES